MMPKSFVKICTLPPFSVITTKVQFPLNFRNLFSANSTIV